MNKSIELNEDENDTRKKKEKKEKKYEKRIQKKYEDSERSKGKKNLNIKFIAEINPTNKKKKYK